jgi:hypothetical protein
MWTTEIQRLGVEGANNLKNNMTTEVLFYFGVLVPVILTPCTLCY